MQKVNGRCSHKAGRPAANGWPHRRLDGVARTWKKQHPKIRLMRIIYVSRRRFMAQTPHQMRPHQKGQAIHHRDGWWLISIRTLAGIALGWIFILAVVIVLSLPQRKYFNSKVFADHVQLPISHRRKFIQFSDISVRLCVCVCLRSRTENNNLSLCRTRTARSEDIPESKRHHDSRRNLFVT